uniref:Ubiquitin-conjugating enzyme E2 14 n=1 Tax=Rhizophora mucronata TaxID=61149 RepID=A0A2P2L236_RHIMU
MSYPFAVVSIESCGYFSLWQVESIVLSIISMLSSPNDESPANVEAAKDWRERRDEFKKKVSRCVRKSQEMV